MAANWGSTFFNAAGTRSSLDEPPKSDPVSGGEDEVVEPDQGNGLSTSSPAILYSLTSY